MADRPTSPSAPVTLTASTMNATRAPSSTYATRRTIRPGWLPSGDLVRARLEDQVGARDDEDDRDEIRLERVRHDRDRREDVGERHDADDRGDRQRDLPVR